MEDHTLCDAVKNLLESKAEITVSQYLEGLRTSIWMLKPGQHEIVATRVKELFA
ncbi:MAG: hypothetical protein OXB98_11460 [Bryobacterales bacterium]|nr:hypothetical protein [Bryobacterales bacterium]